jgi:hypothetical protein
MASCLAVNYQIGQLMQPEGPCAEHTQALVCSNELHVRHLFRPVKPIHRRECNLALLRILPGRFA